MERNLDTSEFDRATEYATQKGFALKTFMQHCIRYGDPNGIDGVLGDPDNVATIRIALGDNVEFARLSLLYLWAQMELAVVWGGLSEEAAAALHFVYAQQAMEATTVDELVTLNGQILHDYAAAVEGVQKSLGKFEPVHICKQFIEEHLYENLNTGMLAERFHFSPDYLSKLFREAEGQPLATYIRNRRLSEAAMLLSNTSMEIAEISTRLHFSSQSHLGSLFKKAYGMTPKEYREASNQRG